MKKKNILTYLLMFIPLFLISLYTHIYTVGIIDLEAYNFNHLNYELLWVGFSISWILIVLFFLYLINNRKKRLIAYTVICALLNVLFFAQICYTQELGKFMIFSDLFVAGEGLQYILGIFAHLDFAMVFVVVINIMIIIIIWKFNKLELNTNDEINKYIIICALILIVAFRTVSYLSLGTKDDDDTWKENYNAKNIYINYTNPNTSMFVSGFYEYNFRATYKYFYNLFFVDKAKLKKNIDDYNKTYHYELSNNNYTGILKDKNVIFVMMESIDSWIIDDETMPTLKYLKETGLDFTNRYSPFFNGGQTINSEFALNTGMYAITERDTIYDIDDVSYKYSMAKMFKKNGYNVNSFHANTGEFYNRTKFHKLLGYNNHYSFKDMQESNILDQNVNYFSDYNAVKDSIIFDLINSDQKHLSFITTYSAHLPYTKFNSLYKELTENNQVYNDDEEYIYRLLANDTDNFLKELIEGLKENNDLDNTVLVLASDHYVYGYSNSEYVAEKKQVLNDNKLLQNTPFVIWSPSLNNEKINTILDTADILPTLLNMMGMEYNPNNYLGTDVFSDYHDKFVWFADNSYIKSEDCLLSDELISTKSLRNIKKNKNILITNYYGG